MNKKFKTIGILGGMGWVQLSEVALNIDKQLILKYDRGDLSPVLLAQ